MLTCRYDLNALRERAFNDAQDRGNQGRRPATVEAAEAEGLATRQKELDAGKDRQ